VSFLKRPSENTCPGIEEFVRPTVSYEVCEKCGGRVEVWSDEDHGVCLDCGERQAKEDPSPSCLEYCEYAPKCKGIIMRKRRALGE
jgi:hypothetical protein